MIRTTYQLSEQDIAFLKEEVDSGKPICTIAKDFGIEYGTLNLRLRDYIKEYKKKNNIIRDKKIIESFKKHGFVSYVEKELGYCDSLISKVLKRNNIKIYDGKNNKNARKRPINDKFFEKINTEEKAYFLGFMYADGCVNIRVNPKRKSSTIYTAKIGLQERDKEILEKLSKLIYNDIILSKYIYKDGRGQDEYILSMYSKQICEDLVKLGCLQRKSSIIKFPSFQQVPENLYHHFLRGYFDGDGSVGKYGKYNYRVTVTSSNQFISDWEVYFKNIVNSSGYIIRFKNYAEIRYSGKMIFDEFKHYLYKDATIFLKRKYEKFFEISNEI